MEGGRPGRAEHEELRQQQARRGRQWGWQGNAMETRRRDAEPRASSREEKGDNGAGQAELPPQAVLLCCSAPSVSCQAPGPLLSPAGTPPQEQEEGAVPAEVISSGGMLGEGVSDKRGWPFICHQGVQTAAPSPGVFLGLICLFFF